MKTIEPDSIAELTIMPYLLGFLVFLAFAGVVTNSRKVLYVWLVLFVLLGIAGLADFYLWGYDYGHNLDIEHAAIKIPGMAYQPPLIGTKKLLNFTASSYPASGGWLLLASIALGFAALFKTNGKFPAFRRSAQNVQMPSVVAATMFIAIFSACAPSPEPLIVGQDACSHCKMTIMEAKYGAELLTVKGKVYKFDAIECLAAFQNSGTVPQDQVHALLVADFRNPGNFLEAAEASYLHSDKLRSPMSMNVAAFADTHAAEKARAELGGEIIDWAEIARRAAMMWPEEATSTFGSMNK